MGEWLYSSTILYFGTRWRRIISFMPQWLYTWGMRLWYPFNGEAGWAPEPVWTLWYREKFLTPLGFEPQQSSLLLYEQSLHPREAFCFTFLVCSWQRVRKLHSNRLKLKIVYCKIFIRIHTIMY
jgi:hypothetical protein